MQNIEVASVTPSQTGADTTHGGNPGTIIFNPRRIGKTLFTTIFVLVVLCLCAHVLRFGFGMESGGGFVTMFDMDQEYNIPTWFSTMLMVVSAVCLALIAKIKHAGGDGWFRHWAGLAVIFTLMSMDESIQIHERFIDPLRQAFGLGGLLTNAWVLLAFVFLIVMALVYFRFLLALPPRSRWMFVLAGCVYVSGVTSIEMISGLMKSEQGMESLAFALSTMVEETVEMSGLAFFIYGLADYMSGQKMQWRISFGGSWGRTMVSR